MSLPGRFALVAGAIGLVGFSGAAATAWLAGRDLARRAMLERLAREAVLVAQVAARTPEEDLRKLAERVQESTGARLTLLSEDGRVLLDSAVEPDAAERLEPLERAPEIEQARVSPWGAAKGRSSLTGEPTLFAASRVAASAPSPVRYVRLALPESSVPPLAGAYAAATMTAVAVALLLVCGTLYGVVLRRMLRPMDNLRETIEEALERGEPPNIETRLGEPAVARLSSAVASLGSMLRGQAERADRERALLASVVAGMREGLLLVGTEGRVLLANEAARAILDMPVEPEGRHLAEVARQPRVVEDVERAAREGRPVEETTVVGPTGRAFALRATPLPAPGAGGAQVLVLLLDVTRLEALERVRRDFVADVSHELRTPLAAIRAFVETLLAEPDRDPAKRREFLEIVERNVLRMQSLIEELTDLSRIETGAIALDIQDVNAREAFRRVFEQLEPKARASHVRLELEVPPSVSVRADPRRLEQILTNLVDNAIKFNRPGGLVRARGEETEGSVRLVVEDTGIGIPSDHLDRIFHRFHRVKRATPESEKGTGLGLAIVKHLVLLHGGRVEVSSQLGQGSRFTLTFPAWDRPNATSEAHGP